MATNFLLHARGMNFTKDSRNMYLHVKTNGWGDMKIVFLSLFLRFFLAKMAVLATSVGLRGNNFAKHNRNMGLTIKMRGQPISHDKPLVRYKN